MAVALPTAAWYGALLGHLLTQVSAPLLGATSPLTNQSHADALMGDELEN